MASHILYDCEALATLSFRHLGRHFIKPGVFEDISVSKILHFFQGVGLLTEWAEGLHKRSITVKVHGSLWCPPFRILFYSVLLCHKRFIELQGLLVASVQSVARFCKIFNENDKI
jgi:hypothetical protein